MEIAMAKTAKAQAQEDSWDNGELGRSEEHARPVTEEMERRIDEAAQLHAISIRLPNSLIEGFKFIAARNKGIGYQTLMKQVLHRFFVSEMKKIARDMAAEMKAQDAQQQIDEKKVA